MKISPFYIFTVLLFIIIIIFLLHLLLNREPRNEMAVNVTVETLTGSSGFSPTSIAGLQVWLDATDPNNNGIQPANNSTITMWYDKSGLGNDAEADKPIVYNTSGLSPNCPALTFTGAEWLSGYANVLSNTLSIFAVCSLDKGANVYGRLVALAPSNGIVDYNNTPSMCFARGNGTNSFQSYRNNTTTSNSLIDPNAYLVPYLFETWYDGTTNYNTVQQGNNTIINTVNSTGNFGAKFYRIGNNTSNTGETMKGFISEILIFNTSLSQSDRETIEGYLSWKWNIQSHLPTPHPYHKVSPTPTTTTSTPTTTTSTPTTTTSTPTTTTSTPTTTTSTSTPTTTTSTPTTTTTSTPTTTTSIPNQIISTNSVSINTPVVNISSPVQNSTTTSTPSSSSGTSFTSSSSNTGTSPITPQTTSSSPGTSFTSSSNAGTAPITPQTTSSSSMIPTSSFTPVASSSNPITASGLNTSQNVNIQNAIKLLSQDIPDLENSTAYINLEISKQKNILQPITDSAIIQKLNLAIQYLYTALMEIDASTGSVNVPDAISALKNYLNIINTIETTNNFIGSSGVINKPELIGSSLSGNNTNQGGVENIFIINAFENEDDDEDCDNTNNIVSSSVPVSSSSGSSIMNSSSGSAISSSILTIPYSNPYMNTNITMNEPPTSYTLNNPYINSVPNTNTNSNLTVLPSDAPSTDYNPNVDTDYRSNVPIQNYTNPYASYKSSSNFIPLTSDFSQFGR